MLVVDVVPLSIDVKEDVIAFCMHWQMLYQCVADLLDTVG